MKKVNFPATTSKENKMEPNNNRKPPYPPLHLYFQNERPNKQTKKANHFPYIFYFPRRTWCAFGQYQQQTEPTREGGRERDPPLKGSQKKKLRYIGAVLLFVCLVFTQRSAGRSLFTERVETRAVFIYFSLVIDMRVPRSSSMVHEHHTHTHTIHQHAPSLYRKKLQFFFSLMEESKNISV